MTDAIPALQNKKRFMQWNMYCYGVHFFARSVVDMGLYCKKVTGEVYSEFVTIPRWKMFMMNTRL